MFYTILFLQFHICHKILSSQIAIHCKRLDNFMLKEHKRMKYLRIRPIWSYVYLVVGIIPRVLMYNFQFLSTMIENYYWYILRFISACVYCIVQTGNRVGAFLFFLHIRVSSDVQTICSEALGTRLAWDQKVVIGRHDARPCTSIH